MEYRLGVLGGMGPQATNTFYQFVIDRTEASCDQEHVNALILSDSQMPDRTEAILGSEGEREAVFQRLLADARLLEGAGCTVIAVPCNTSHFFLDRVQEQVGVAHPPHDTGNRPSAGLPGVSALAFSLRMVQFSPDYTKRNLRLWGFRRQYPRRRPRSWSCP